MNDRFESHLFWGSYSPLSMLSGSALIILASSRLAFALVCAASLIWVYGLTTLVFSVSKKILPEYGKILVLLFLSSFMCGIFMILMGLINPLLMLGTGFFIFLIAPCFLGAGLFESSRQADLEEVISRAVLEAFVLSLIIISFALIREPLGMGTLSFPGGPEGIKEIFGSGEAFIPVRILSTSAGALLLLGYGTALFRYLRERTGATPPENNREDAQ